MTNAGQFLPFVTFFSQRTFVFDTKSLPFGEAFCFCPQKNRFLLLHSLFVHCAISIVVCRHICSNVQVVSGLPTA